MIAYELFSTVILLLSLFLANTGVDGFRKSCPTAASVNLTDETANSSGYTHKSGVSFSPRAICMKNGTTFGCLCDFETCLHSCCPEGFASIAAGFASIWEPNCNETDEKGRRTFTFVSSRRIFEKYDEAVSVITDNPYCYPIEIDDWMKKDYVSGLSVGSMNWSFKFEDKIGFQECTPNIHRNRTTGMDVNFSWTSIYSNEDGINWLIISSHVSLIFVLPTFMIYSVIPELKNLQGSLFRCHLASYIAFVLTLTIFFTLYESIVFELYVISTLEVNVTLCSVFITLSGVLYFGFASLLWLNVMSFEIWRTFRIFQFNQEINIKKRQKAKFIRYCIYSWGGAAVYTFLANFWISDRVPVLGSTYSLIDFAGFGISITNTYFYVSTAITIRKRKKETEHLVDGLKKHYKENEPWFILYLKLFIIEEGFEIVWIVYPKENDEISVNLVCALLVLQSIAIFFVFVWKDDVKRLCRKRFGELLRALCSFFRRHPTQDSSVV